MKKIYSVSHKGFMLLPAKADHNYRGVDRNPFLPKLSEPLATRLTPGKPGIWTFIPLGWRQDAYRLFEEHSTRSDGDDLELLSDYEIAVTIQEMIAPHVGWHDIVVCQIWPLEATSQLEAERPTLGYDLAYPGGDFYSAVWNGLLCEHAHPNLVKEFGARLNQFGLFTDTRLIPDYVHRYQEMVHSEANATFCIYRLDDISSE
ncbi:MAG: hypothetical protein KKD28_15805 [Chloroflexi bacterium]|nr:hypothetical protein [Chloroflexota bacterium]MBU1662923.1 hypothetical protein [Chloroflexota bacterium]